MSTRLLAALIVLAPALSLADEPPPSLRAEAPPVKKDRGELQIAVKAGGLFSEPFSALGPSYLVDLELGYVLPVWRHHLAISLEGAYTAPTADGKQSDARLDASGSYAWHVEQREVILGATFFYRHPIKRFVPYVGIGPRLFLLETRVQGQAGAAPIFLSTETSTKIGAGIPIGCGFVLGPGHLFAELALILGNIDHTTTGNVAVGVSSITLAIGYRFTF